MSRIGRLPVSIPSGVDIKVEGQDVLVKGPKGELSLTVVQPITVELGEGNLEVKRPNDERDSRSRHGLTRSLIHNMVLGVTEGYEKKMEIHGTGYRVATVAVGARGAREKKGEVPGAGCRVAGRAGPRACSVGPAPPSPSQPPAGINFAVENPTRFSVQGIDKQLVGEVAANIRKLRKPDPYKGKGVRYAGEQIRRKVGKAGK